MTYDINKQVEKISNLWKEISEYATLYELDENLNIVQSVFSQRLAEHDKNMSSYGYDTIAIKLPDGKFGFVPNTFEKLPSSKLYLSDSPSFLDKVGDKIIYPKDFNILPYYEQQVQGGTKGVSSGKIAFTQTMDQKCRNLAAWLIYECSKIEADNIHQFGSNRQKYKENAKIAREKVLREKEDDRGGDKLIAEISEIPSVLPPFVVAMGFVRALFLKKAVLPTASLKITVHNKKINPWSEYVNRFGSLTLGM